LLTFWSRTIGTSSLLKGRSVTLPTGAAKIVPFPHHPAYLTYPRDPWAGTHSTRQARWYTQTETGFILNVLLGGARLHYTRHPEWLEREGKGVNQMPIAEARGGPRRSSPTTAAPIEPTSTAPAATSLAILASG
jgi:hypothetical protein